MQTEFTYRELSEKLNINLIKLKRWGREFLEPDYSAGQQQGHARIITIDEAMSLYLAGHLVSNLKYSIPETKKIIKVIILWMRDKYLLPTLLREKQNTARWSMNIGVDIENDYVCLEVFGKTKYSLSDDQERQFDNFNVSTSKTYEEGIFELVEPLKFDLKTAYPKPIFKTLHLSLVVDEFLVKLNAETLRDNFLFDPEV